MDTNQNGIADEADVYAYSIANIFDKISSTSSATLASATNYTTQSSDVLTGGSSRRLGYVLTDYNFKFSFKEDWLETDPSDPWNDYEPAAIYTGTAVKNQTDADGTTFYPLMYNMRGIPMWWGAGIIWSNDAYPANSICDWAALR